MLWNFLYLVPTDKNTYGYFFFFFFFFFFFWGGLSLISRDVLGCLTEQSWYIKEINLFFVFSFLNFK